MAGGYKLDRDESGLTAREREVRDLLAAGMRQTEIAERLGIGKQRVGQIRKQIAEAEARGIVTARVGGVTAVLSINGEGEEQVDYALAANDDEKALADTLEDRANATGKIVRLVRFDRRTELAIAMPTNG
jgi:DNA-binding transcriptional regulator LsrR (DeoR family)